MIINENTSDPSVIEKYTERAARLIESRAAARGRELKAFVATFGCQQNEADSETLMGQLEKMGCAKAKGIDDADIIIYNTCAVREHAELRALSKTGQLKHMKEKNPDLIVGLWGCMVSQEHRKETIKQSYPYVDFVAGTNMMHRLPEILCDVMETGRRRYYVDDSPHIITEGLDVARSGDISAWLPVMYGCDNFCTYCVVPYVRGRERSREPSFILDDARKIIADGYREITLLGQNVNSYGKGLDGSEKATFAKLLSDVCALDGDFWVRFMTSHPKDASDELIETIAENPKAAKHFHLPMQAGNDEILRRMNRKYTSGDFLKLAEKIKTKIPGVTLTSDIIVGFPGETEEQFCDTLSMMEKVGFDSVYAFIYSPRSGTPAAKMEDPVSDEEKSERFSRLCALESEISEKKCRTLVGTRERLLCTSQTADINGYFVGRTSGNRTVRFENSVNDENIYGRFVDVEITRSEKTMLFGKRV